MYYSICPNCGSNLDPGERCDCTDEKKKAALDVATIQSGKGEKKPGETIFSPSSLA